MSHKYKKHFFVFAGEPSGDKHGAKLLPILKQQVSHLTITGVGGPAMRKEGIDCVLRMEDFSVMGFSDVLWSLPRLWKQFYQLCSYLLKHTPDAIIFIDSPGLSLRMTKQLRKRGYRGKIIQYISPTVWAWGRERIDQMSKTLDLLLTIYPFEAAYFAHTSLRVQYVGNPLQEEITHYRYEQNWREPFGISLNEELVGLFPGSRPKEVLRHLPGQLKAAQLMVKARPGVSLAISCAHEDLLPLIKQQLEESRLDPKRFYIIPEKNRYDLMRSCRSALAKSGTVTLELALHQCPSVVMYVLTKLNRFIAKNIMKIRLPYYCIVNILAGLQVFPEFIACGYSPEQLQQQLLALHEEGSKRNVCLEECLRIKNDLRAVDSSKTAVKAILELWK